MTTSTINTGDARYLRPGQAARRLGVCTATIREMIDRGELDAIQLPSGHNRVAEQSVDALLTVAST